jgi:hypothetical protein
MQVEMKVAISKEKGDLLKSLEDLKEALLIEKIEHFQSKVAKFMKVDLKSSQEYKETKRHFQCTFSAI